MANDPAYSRLTDPPPTQLPLRHPGDVTEGAMATGEAVTLSGNITHDNTLTITLDESRVRADERSRCKADVCPHCAKGEVPAREKVGWRHGDLGWVPCEASGIWEREWVESPAATPEHDGL